MQISRKNLSVPKSND